jgi:hypothetical protein
MNMKTRQQQLLSITKKHGNQSCQIHEYFVHLQKPIHIFASLLVHAKTREADGATQHP